MLQQLFINYEGKIINYANEYPNIRTDSEYEYLINHNYQVSNFYTNYKSN